MNYLCKTNFTLMTARSYRIIALILLLITLFLSSDSIYSQENKGVRLEIRDSKKRQNFDYFRRVSLYNAASGAFLESSSLMFSFENQFFMKELMGKMVSSIISFKKNTFIAKSNHSGYAKYGTLHLTAGYSRLFSKKFAVGMQFHYLLDHASQYKAYHSLTFDVALHAQLNERFSLGFLAYNPAGLKYHFTGDIAIPMLLKLNFAYNINRQLLFCGSIEKALPGFFNVSLGLDYSLSFLTLSGNVSLAHLDFHIGTYFRAFLIEITSKYHYHLGYSPALSFYYLF